MRGALFTPPDLVSKYSRLYSIASTYAAPVALIAVASSSPSDPAVDETTTSVG